MAEHCDALGSIRDARRLVRHSQLLQQTGDHPGEIPAEQRRMLRWAGAMTDIAAEHCASLTRLAPAQRRQQLNRIGALVETARTLCTSAPPQTAFGAGVTAR